MIASVKLGGRRPGKQAENSGKILAGQTKISLECDVQRLPIPRSDSIVGFVTTIAVCRCTFRRNLRQFLFV
jgi:hypothetical protein